MYFQGTVKINLMPSTYKNHELRGKILNMGTFGRMGYGETFGIVYWIDKPDYKSDLSLNFIEMISTIKDFEKQRKTGDTLYDSQLFTEANSFHMEHRLDYSYNPTKPYPWK